MESQAFEHAGRSIPARVGDAIAELEAARRGAAWVPLPWRTILAVRGRDAALFLQGMLTQEIANLAPGEVRQGCQVDRRGRLLAEMWIRRLDDGVDLEIQLDRLEAVRESLDRHHFLEDATFEQMPELSVLLLTGPSAGKIAVSIDLPVWPVRDAGGADFHILTPDPVDLGARLTAAGAVPLGGQTLDRLRIEAGIPWFGREMGHDTLPLEVGLEAAISFEKGCYVGQEAVARLHYQGKPRSGLAGVRFMGDPAPSGSPIFSADEHVGTLRSVAPAPKKDAGDAIGLATLRREILEEGRLVRISGRDARIEILPFREGRDA